MSETQEVWKENMEDGFVKIQKQMQNFGLYKGSPYDMRFWMDFAEHPLVQWDYSFARMSNRLDHVLKVMKLFRPSGKDFENFREFCELAEKVYDVLYVKSPMSV